MPTDKTPPTPVVRKPVESPLAPLEIAALLVKHYGLHEGLFDLMVEFQIGVGPVGPPTENRLPGVMLGVARLGLVPTVSGGGAITVDAGAVNPAKKTRKKTGV